MKKYSINFFHIIIDNIKKIFFQNFCQYCLKKIDNYTSKNTYFCNTCKNIDTKNSFLSFHTKKNIPIYALGRYEGIIKHIVIQKYFKNKIPFLELKQTIHNFLNIFNIEYDIIIPIPKTTLNKIKHTFNPTKILASIFSEYQSKKIFFDVFFKGFKKDQIHKTYDERKNIKENFFFLPPKSKKEISEKNILIIDDVYTTGSTISNLISALPKGYKKISIFVIAKK